MAQAGFKRKLTTIFSADVAGYSRLMQDDEAATVKTLEHYKHIMSELIGRHRGRVVDSPGDNLLAEFASVVDAVQCAIAVQQELQTRNAELTESRRMRFRIGVNLGDVIEEESRIYGDGVNIAARLESLADPGGLCISKSAFEQVETKLPLKYESLGQQSVKNIAKPVVAYRVVLKPRVIERKREQASPQGRRWKKPLVFGSAAVLLVMLSGVLVWQVALRPVQAPAPPIDRTAGAPSIAVLPFTNMSDDPQQEYFSDGISEDIITDLSKVSGLIVIARTSSFTYKGKSVTAQQIGKDLQVRYLLEGSVRKVGDLVRINAQLIDAAGGRHLWAERYDGRMEDVFALQDRITRKIIAALALKLTAREENALADKGTANPAAYDEYLRGWQSYRLLTNAGFAAAKVHLEKAVELDPEFARAYAALAVLYWKAVQLVGLKQGLGLTSTAAVTEALAKSMSLTRSAMRKPVALAHGLMSQVYLHRYLHDEARSETERAVAMDPNDPELHLMMSTVLWFAGETEKAVESVKTALRLDPQNPAEYLRHLARVVLPDGDLHESLVLLDRAQRLNPELSAAAESTRVIIYGMMGREEDARNAFEAFVKTRLDSSLISIMPFLPFADPRTSSRIAEVFLKAGAPGKITDNFNISRSNLVPGKQIKALLYGGKINGINAAGGPFSLECSESGECELIRDSFRGRWHDTGTSWIEGDIFFIRFKKLFGGLPYGNSIFRNPGGSKESRNEYYLVSDLRGISTFTRTE